MNRMNRIEEDDYLEMERAIRQRIRDSRSFVFLKTKVIEMTWDRFTLADLSALESIARQYGFSVKEYVVDWDTATIEAHLRSDYE